jgi:deazaflavin-dependent oxidoreductase (nitroreductase family)
VIADTMADKAPSFRKPNLLEQAFNRLFGMLVGRGFGLSHNYLLQVRGRKTGQVYETPVNLLLVDGKRYLVAPRGNTQWVQNARSSGEIWLKKGRRRNRFQVKELRDEDKPRLLKLYLDKFYRTVQRYFPVPAGSDPERFVALSAQYPVFELEPLSSSPGP